MLYANSLSPCLLCLSHSSLIALVYVVPVAHLQKTKLREKKNNRVVFTKALYDSAVGSAAKKARYVTLYTLIEQYKIGGSLARRLVRELTKNGSLKVVSPAGGMSVYAPAAVEESA